MMSLIVMNIFEIFIFRFLFIIICHILFSIENNTVLLIFFIISIPIIAIIIHSFLINHLYYFSPHFVIYPYDYFSSFNDIFHLIQKYIICISLQSSNINLNQFLFIIVFIMQMICFLFSAYILYFKSYYIMNNIFLNKVRFSSNLSIPRSGAPPQYEKRWDGRFFVPFRRVRGARGGTGCNRRATLL